jgi:outer membrane protein OmpA-like peptidoglycan-associated protein
LSEIENLKIHSRNVEDRLIRAEEDLARADNGGRRASTLPPGVSARLADLASRYPILQYDPATGISKFDTDLLFDSGDDRLRPGADRILAEFAELFNSPEASELKIMVVGHADSQGIKGHELRERYPTNWHLSAGRALVVADHLRAAGIPESRMGVAGFGQFQPVASNDSDNTRQRNRRVEIFVLGPETPCGWLGRYHGTRLSVAVDRWRDVVPLRGHRGACGLLPRMLGFRWPTRPAVLAYVLFSGRPTIIQRVGNGGKQAAHGTPRILPEAACKFLLVNNLRGSQSAHPRPAPPRV